MAPSESTRGDKAAQGSDEDRDDRSRDGSSGPGDSRGHGADGSRNGEDGQGENDHGDDGGKKKRGGLKDHPIALAVAGAAALVLLIGGLLYWLHARNYETTDDAFVDTHIVRLAPRISGRVQRVLVEDNQQVKAGQPVLELDPRDSEARLSQAQASKAQAEASIAQATAQLAQIDAQVQASQATARQAREAAGANQAQATSAARDLARYQSLKTLNPAAVAQQQFDQATAQAQATSAQLSAALQQARASEAQVRATASQRKTALAQIDAGRAQVASAEAQIREAELELDYNVVRAPVEGTVAQRTVAVGNYVNAGAQAMAIVPLKTWVTANYKETQLALMRRGQPVSVRVDACPSHRFRGHVDSIQRGSGQVFGVLPPENATGNYVKVVQRVPVKIIIDDRDADCPLGPGLSAEPRVKVR